MSRAAQHIIRLTALAGGLAAIGACTTPAPPPPPPPPPPVEAVPYRPLPPAQAAYVMDIPRVGPLGVRQTVNTGISDDERVWHFRSAWNVAALNCLAPQYQPILDGYSDYIKTHGRPLKAVNDRIDADYRKEASSRREAIMARESQMTMVYNYFALPPARGEFCDSALQLSNQYLAADSVDPAAFALTNFSTFEQPFENFFRAYEEYERSAAAWDAQYGARYGASQPGYVAVQQARSSMVAPQPGVSDPALLSSQANIRTTTAVDPETGARIPVTPVDTANESVPIVQPIPADAGDNDTPQQ
ncbi:hypothetical protein P8Q88_12330 [Qipengyuania sp. XHP0207]|uniref:hypothetical protein n=1 Tax=Qipengyuania sp. XHP0207 TaxID=3038078 RepID=UPI00241CA5A2|nr:hypothetical protein [Qipengyuania sp. XHP0207]MDG5748961.1 hypothetical protein [Qipengyuania sp. XHP0207]